MRKTSSSFSLPLVPFALGVAFGVIALAVIMVPALHSAALPSVDGVVYAPSAWKTTPVQQYINNTYWVATVAYPRDFEVRENNAGGSSTLNANPVEFVFPRDAFTDVRTNFSEAWVSVDTSQYISVANCVSVPNATGATKNIGGVAFVVGSDNGAGAGNFYDSTVYRAVVDGVCTEVTTTLHTTNIGNYEPGTVTEFDTTKTDVIFAAILDTITFSTSPSEE